MTTQQHNRILLVAHEDVDRLDRFVHAHFHNFSRSRCAQLIKDNWVLLNGHNARPSSPVRNGNTVTVEIPPLAPSKIVPQEMPLEIIYQDAHVLIVDKPAGIAVHPGPGHPDRTLVNALLALAPDLADTGSDGRPGIVHRLDKDTSGLIVVVRSNSAYVSMTKQLSERRVSKGYVAVVTGILKNIEGEIDQPISRHPRHRKRMAVVPSGKDALTRYRVVARFPRHTLVEVYPVTGRTHQIRVHFAYIGHPILGDSIYGKSSVILRRHFLHAAKLGFFMPPKEHAWREFEAPLPDDLTAALELISN